MVTNPDPIFGVRNDRIRRTSLPKNMLFVAPNNRRNKKHGDKFKSSLESNDVYYTPTHKDQTMLSFLSFIKNISDKISTKYIVIISTLILVLMLTILKSFSNEYKHNPIYTPNEKEILQMLHSKEWKWPISVRTEEDHFETILHPADSSIQLNVPRFFINGPLSKDGKLMTPNIAHAMGNQRTIFIHIVSYKDDQCRFTVENIFKRAKYPDRIRVGVVDQIDFHKNMSCDIPCNDKVCKYRNQIDVYELDASLVIGPMAARHIAQRMYRGEYYVLQINSHVTFIQDWDVSIIKQWSNTNNEMAVLSTILTDSIGSINDNGQPIKTSRFILCNSDYKPASMFHILQHQNQPEIHTNTNPTLQPYWSSTFSFSRGHFLVNVPYDIYLPMLYRQGEEISITIRGFTHGYDYYTPSHNVAFDTSAITNYNENNKRVYHKTTWENSHNFKTFEKKSLMRLLGLIQMNPTIDTTLWSHREENKYGIGAVRHPSKFFQAFGIHTQVKRTEQKLCYFVQSGQMHDLFHPQLRSNGMGIDYDKIHYRFHEKAMKD